MWPRVNGLVLGASVSSANRHGLVLKGWRGGTFGVAYGEILTAERLRNRFGLRLHTVGHGAIRIRVRGEALAELEGRLRGRGVRIVDCWGAMITPTLADFERALAEGPRSVRQSSDSA